MNAMQSLLDLATTSAGCAPCAESLRASGSSPSATWSGVLGVENQMTGDGRFIELNALYWDDLPLPIRYVAQDIGAHDGAQVVGRITRIWREDDGRIMGEGDFDLNSPHGKEAMRQVKEGLTTGVSMDLDDVSFEVRMSSELVSLMETDQLTADEDAEADEQGRVKVAAVKSDDEVRITTSGRIRAATIVAIPAFAEAKIALVAAGGHMQTFGYDPGQARAPKGQKDGGQWVDTPGSVEDALTIGASFDWVPMTSPTHDLYDEITVADIQPGDVIYEAFDGGGNPFTKQGAKKPLGYKVLKDNGIDNDGYHSFKVEGDDGFGNKFTTDIEFWEPMGVTVGRSKIKDQYAIEGGSDADGGDVGVDPDVVHAVAALRRCATVDFLSEEYMALAQIALNSLNRAQSKDSKIEEAAAKLDAFLLINWTDLSMDNEQPDDEQPDLSMPEDYPLLAAATPKAPPRAWFRDPHLTEATPLTVTDDGRVYGHLAVWDTCHIGHAHSGCVKPPRSKAKYAYFRVGSVLTDDGSEVATGRITLETRHALGTLNATQTLAHYEDTGRAVADVAAGEDRHGIWVAGAMRPGATGDQVRALRGSPLSGDWRRIGGNLELVAALAVNVPGFPIPRPSGLVASGNVQSLVASGMVPPRRVIAPGKPGALSDDDLRYLKSLAARERETARRHAEAMHLKVRVADLAMRRKEFALKEVTSGV